MSRNPTLLDRRQLLITTAGTATAMLMSPLTQLSAATNQGPRPGRSQLFNLGWRFRRGEGTGFESPGFDDSAWRKVDLPHDWSIEDLPLDGSDASAHVVGPFNSKSEGGTATGFSVGGEGWYRKRFQLDLRECRVEILFEGVYMDCDLWLNGHPLGTHAYGYTSFAHDLTPHLSPNGDNLLAIRVRNLGKNSRWYSGSGIYRNVWLDILPEQARIARWGVAVATRRILDAEAEIEIGTRLEDVNEGLTLIARVKDAHGHVVRETSIAAAAEIKQTLTIAAPALWSPDHPALYTLESELRRGGVIVDRSVTSFGIRIVAFDATKGMTINGVPTKLRGGCIHHDNGLLGAAAFDVAEARKVQRLKARGYNAVRPSHNPFSPAFLHACDGQGMLVLAETFDAWREPKLPQDYSVYFDAQWREDLATLVLSARNHPCIFAWSIGNEIPGRNSSNGVETQWNLANEVHRLDPTRPVTAAINGFAGHLVRASQATARTGMGNVADHASAIFLDIVGYNYKLADYESDHQQFPDRIFLGTESFPKDVAAIWELTDRSPWLIGDFVWTAMDYLGEAGIGGSGVVPASAASNPAASMAAWPWVNAYCGDIDLIGEQKAPSLARDVVWGLSPLEITVQRPIPDGKVDMPRTWGWHDEHRSWTWPGAEGKTLTVRVYTVGDRVELRFNGALLVQRQVAVSDLKCIELAAPYQAGTLEAVAFRGGAEIGRRQLTTVGAPAAIRLTPERSRSGSARADISYVGVEVVDAKGRVVPDTNTMIQLAVSGPAELVAFGSAAPFALGSFQSATAQTWDGRALAILRGTGLAGHVRIEGSAEGLRAGATSLQLKST